MALVAFPQIYGLAWLVVALGVAARLVPLLERHARAFRRFVQVSFPLALAIGGDPVGIALGSRPEPGNRERRASPLPPPGSPNVLLIVMDTVAAGHLSLHGYDRATSTTLVELAEHGIRFDSAQAASSWTLPSHATMFTGRWMHELSVGWLTPLDDTHPTLAEFLGARGLRDGRIRGQHQLLCQRFGPGSRLYHYRDFIFPELTAFKMTALVGRALKGSRRSVDFLEDPLELDRVRPYVQYLWRWFDADRKTAAMVNREFLDWLSRRAQPERPFFAFLNYFDAHYPYQLPRGGSTASGHAE